MEEQLISFNTAKLAKEKGFPQGLFNTGWYNRFGNLNGRVDINKNGEHLYCGLGTYTSEPKKKVSKEEFEEYTSVKYQAPTQSLLQRWLREVHNIHIGGEVRWNNFENEEIIYEFWIKDMREVKVSKRIFTEPSCLSYEEALEIGLQEALKLIKL